MSVKFKSEILTVDWRRKLGSIAKLPEATLYQLDRAGLQRISDLKQRRFYNAAHAAGMGEPLLRELLELSELLDIPDVDLQTATFLQRSGILRGSDYFDLQYEKQEALEAAKPHKHPDLGAILGSLLRRQTDLEPPPPGIAETRPYVDWTWGPDSVPIDTRPWWGLPDQDVSNIPNSDTYQDQVYWYPDAKKGWKVLCYNFGKGGAGRAQFGYLIVYNVYTGVLRLFVYLVPVTERQFTKLLADICIVDAKGIACNSWTFPVMELQMTTADGLTHQVGSSITFDWPGYPGVAYHDLSATSIGGGGQWLRTEISTLYDPRLYPEDVSDSFLAGNERRMLQVRFYGVSEGEASLEANLEVQLSGNAVATTPGQGPDTMEYFKNAISGSVKGFSTGKTVQDAAATLGKMSKGYLLGGIGAAIGAVFSLLETDSNVPPEYRISIFGTAIGPIKGKIITNSYPATFGVNLDGTFSVQPTGGPEVFQRCDDIRLGILGFGRAGIDPANVSVDPRPESINIEWVPVDETYSNYRPLITIDPMGAFLTNSWAEVDLVSQSVHLEVVKIEYDKEPVREDTEPNQPPSLKFKRPLEFPDDTYIKVPLEVTQVDYPWTPRDHVEAWFGGEELISALASNRWRVVTTIEGLEVLQPEYRVYLRWSASLNPRNADLSPFDVQYALEVTDRVHIGSQPGSGGPYDDWDG